MVGKSKSQAGVCKKSATDMKTKSQLKKLAWKFFSIWIKKRDKKKCYTCPATGCVKQNAQAGHYPPGSILPEREYFNEKLVHLQCFRCNINFSGNPVAYRKNLIRDYDIAFVEEIENKCGKPDPLSHQELKTIIEKYNATSKKPL